MNPNEPTTGEIVEALRIHIDPLNRCLNRTCQSCVSNKMRELVLSKACDDGAMKAAADRLESQEREIESLKAEALCNAIENAERFAALTARAESAEAERDAAKADIKKYAMNVHTCGNSASGMCRMADEDHGFCERCPAWEWRGLQPQDGGSE